EKLLALDPYVLDEEIEIARVRFQHTYDIPTSEVDQQLRIAGNIPGTQFRSNMIQRYGFKDLPLMMRDLPSSVVKVPE
ncbi:hypothetical protein ABFV43_22375, partial [Pseudomonas fulva]|uniref:hypothetical protein n=1 Tax=Pseudomonas fulva TaxID=47880 RepID=UPI0034D3C6B3